MSRLWLLMVSLLLLLAAPAAADVVYTVDSTADQPDAAPGNGICATSAGACTLRAATMEVTAAPDGRLRIDVPSGTYELDRPGAGEDLGATGDLDLGFPTGSASAVKRVWLTGAGAARTVVDGGQLDRVLHIASRGGGRMHPYVRGLTLRGGRLDDGVGGGLAIEDLGHLGTARALGITLRDNQAGSGGGLAVHGTALKVSRSAIVLNRALDGGGGALSDASLLDLTNTTVAFNRSDGAGGGIAHHDDGSMELLHVSINANQGDAGAGGIHVVDDTFPGRVPRMTNSVIDNNSGPHCDAPLDSDGGNVFGDFSCGLDHATDVQDDDPLKLHLRLNGGQTPSLALEINHSAARDHAIADYCPPFDQRGAPRPLGAGCDSGAFEARVP